MNEAGRAALIVCHPGHELRVFGWMAAARPRVFVLTDGSGSRAKSRLKSTHRVLDAVGAEPGSWFGRCTDSQLYERLRAHDYAYFSDVAEELADQFTSLGCELVVADAAEGYNSGHDVCRLLVDAAVGIARQRSVHPLDSRAIALVGPPGVGAGIRVELTPELWQQKLSVARAYPELAHEVEAGVRQYGAAAFATETLLPIADPFLLPSDTPYYEDYGSRQVANRLYPEVIRQHDHVAPLAQALAVHVARCG